MATAGSRSASKRREVVVDRLLAVERDRFRLTLYDLESVERAEYRRLLGPYSIAVGAKGYRTPRGVYRINSKAKNPEWLMPDSEWVAPELRGSIIPGGDPRNPLKSRWLGITDPIVGVGIHGTADEASLGQAASHGCLRMAVPDVEELFSAVPLGTPIYIV